MSVIIVTDGGESHSVVSAFREETSAVITVAADGQVAAVADELARSEVEAVVCASADGVGTARAIQHALAVEDSFGDLPVEFAAQRSAAGVGGVTGGVRHTVAVVSRGGAHVSAGVYQDAFVGDNPVRLRSRISVPSDSPIASIAETCARTHLDGFGVRDGASCVQVDVIGESAQLVGISPGVLNPGFPVDGSFRAYGHSHEHLLAESVLRPREFERRIVRPLQPGLQTLALFAFRTPADGALRTAAALRTVRRLTGFHGITAFEPSAVAAPGSIAAIAVFLHSDRASVANSLAIVTQIDETESMFTENYQLIGLAPTAS